MKRVLTLCMFALTLFANAQLLSTTIKSKEEAPAWIKVYKDNYMGYITVNGQELVPPVYEEIGAFGDVYEGLAIVQQGGLLGLINRDGKEVVLPIYESIQKADNFNKDWLLVSINGLYGFIDATGKEVVAPIYTEIVPVQQKQDKITFTSSAIPVK